MKSTYFKILKYLFGTHLIGESGDDLFLSFFGGCFGFLLFVLFLYILIGDNLATRSLIQQTVRLQHYCNKRERERERERFIF